MERGEVLKVVVLLLGWNIGHAQSAPTHVHTPPPTVKGSEHPEQVSDRRAWLTQLIVVTSPGQQATLHAKALGLDGFDLKGFRNRYDTLVNDYNNRIKADYSPDTVEAAQHELYNNIDFVMTDMVSYLYRNLSKEEWNVVNRRMQETKRFITFGAKVPEGAQPALIPAAYKLRRVQGEADFNQYSYAGYSQYTALDSDGTNWYQTVYVYGASNVTWTCTWTQIGQYNWAWEPPGCNPNGPPVHTFYVTNQIGGAGANGSSLGGYSAPQYVNLSNSLQVTVSGSQQSSFSGINIICPIVGAFFVWINNVSVAIAVTDYIMTDKEGTECLYYLYCPNGNTALTCPADNPVYVDGTQNLCLSYLYDKRIRVNINGTNHCFPVGKAYLTSTAHNCS